MKNQLFVLCVLLCVTGYIKGVSGSGTITPDEVTVDQSIAEFEYSVNVSGGIVTYIEIDNPFETEFLVVSNFTLDNNNLYLYNSPLQPIDEGVVNWYYNSSEKKLILQVSVINSISDSADFTFYTSVPHTISTENYFSGIIKPTSLGIGTSITGIPAVAVTPGAPRFINIENQADGEGSTFSAGEITTDGEMELYSVLRDKYLNYISNPVSHWVLEGGTIPSSQNSDEYTFSPSLTGYYTLSVSNSGFSDTASINVLPGLAKKLVIGRDPGGYAGAQNDTTLIVPDSLTLYSYALDAENNFVGNISVNWSSTDVLNPVTVTDNMIEFGPDTAPSNGKISITLNNLQGASFNYKLRPGSPQSMIFVSVTDSTTGLDSVKLSSDQEILISVKGKDFYGNNTGFLKNASWVEPSDLGELIYQNDSTYKYVAKYPGSGSIKVVYQSIQNVIPLSVTTGNMTSIKIRTAPDGAGEEFTSRTITTDDQLELFAAGYDNDDNFIQNVDVHWTNTDLLNPVDIQGVSSIVFSPAKVSDGGVFKAVSETLTALTGVVDVTHGVEQEIYILASTDSSDTLHSINMTSDDTIELFCASYDAEGNFIDILGNVVWKDSLLLGTISNGAQSIIYSATNAGQTWIIAQHQNLRRRLSTYISPGEIKTLKIRTAPGDMGSVYSGSTITADDYLNLYAAGYDADGIFVENPIVTWTSTEQLDSLSISSSELIFEPVVAPSSRILKATLSGEDEIFSETGEIIVEVGGIILYRMFMDNAAITSLDLTTDEEANLHVQSYDADGNVVDIPAVSWEVSPQLGVFTPEIGGNTLFVASDSGSGKIIAILEQDTLLKIPVTVSGGMLHHIKIMDAPYGMGSEIGDISLSTDDSLTLYCAGFDEDENYLGDQPAIWRISDTSFVNDLSDTTGEFIVFSPSGFSDTPISISATNANVGPDFTGLISITGGALDYIELLVEIGGNYQPLANLSLTTDDLLNLKVEGYDSDNNYLRDVSVNWSAEGNLGLFNQPGTTPTNTFTANKPGGGLIRVDTSLFSDELYLTVNYGAVATIEIRTLPNGNGKIYMSPVEMPVDSMLNLYATPYDADYNLIPVDTFTTEWLVNSLDINDLIIVDDTYARFIPANNNQSGTIGAVIDGITGTTGAISVVSQPNLIYMANSITPAIITLNDKIEFRLEVKNSGDRAVTLNSESNIWVSDGIQYLTSNLANSITIFSGEIRELVFDSLEIPNDFSGGTFSPVVTAIGVDTAGNDFIQDTILTDQNGLNIVVLKLDDIVASRDTVTQRQSFSVQVSFTNHSDLPINDIIVHLDFVNSNSSFNSDTLQLASLDANDTETLNFLCSTIPTITPGEYIIDAKISGVLNGLFISDTGATNVDLLVVKKEPAINYINASMAPVKSTLGKEVTIELNFMNESETGVTIDENLSYLTFDNNGTNLVLPLQTNSYFAPNSPGVLIFGPRLIPVSVGAGSQQPNIKLAGTDDNDLVFSDSLVIVEQFKFENPVLLSMEEPTFSPSSVTLGGEYSFNLEIKNVGGVDVTLFKDSTSLLFTDGAVAYTANLLDDISISRDSVRALVFVAQNIPVEFQTGDYNVVVECGGLDENHKHFHIKDTTNNKVLKIQSPPLPEFNGQLLPEKLFAQMNMELTIGVTNSGDAGLYITEGSYITIIDNNDTELNYRIDLASSVELGGAGSTALLKFKNENQLLPLDPGIYQTEIYITGKDANGTVFSPKTIVGGEVTVDLIPYLTFVENSLSPDTIIAGNSVSFLIKVRNDGNEKITLADPSYLKLFDSLTTQSISVGELPQSVNPGQEVNIWFKESQIHLNSGSIIAEFNYLGNYFDTLRTNDNIDAGVFEIVELTNFTYENASILPKRISAGQYVSFSLEISNYGDQNFIPASGILSTQTNLKLSDSQYTLYSNLKTETIIGSNQTVELIFDSVLVPSDFDFGDYTPQLNLNGIDQNDNLISGSLPTSIISIVSPSLLTIAVPQNHPIANPSSVTLGDADLEILFYIANSGSADALIENINLKMFVGGELTNGYEIELYSEHDTLFSGEEDTCEFRVNIPPTVNFTEDSVSVFGVINYKDLNSSISKIKDELLLKWELNYEPVYQIDSVRTSQDFITGNQNSDWSIKLYVHNDTYLPIGFGAVKIEMFNGANQTNDFNLRIPQKFWSGANTIASGARDSIEVVVDSSGHYTGNGEIGIRSIIYGIALSEPAVLVGDSTSQDDGTNGFIKILSEADLVLRNVRVSQDTVNAGQTYPNLIVTFIMENLGQTSLSFSELNNFTSNFSFLDSLYQPFSDFILDNLILPQNGVINGGEVDSFSVSIVQSGISEGIVNSRFSVSGTNPSDTDSLYSFYFNPSTDFVLNEVFTVIEPAELNLTAIRNLSPVGNKVNQSQEFDFEVDIQNSGSEIVDTVWLKLESTNSFVGGGELKTAIILLTGLYGNSSKTATFTVKASQITGNDSVWVTIDSSYSHNSTLSAKVLSNRISNSFSIEQSSGCEIISIDKSLDVVSANQKTDWFITPYISKNGEGDAIFAKPEITDVIFKNGTEILNDFVVIPPLEFTSGGLELNDETILENPGLKYRINTTGETTGLVTAVFSLKFADINSGITSYLNDSTTFIVESPAIPRIVTTDSVITNILGEPRVNINQNYQVNFTVANEGDDEIDKLKINLEKIILDDSHPTRKLKPKVKSNKIAVTGIVVDSLFITNLEGHSSIEKTFQLNANSRAGTRELLTVRIEYGIANNSGEYTGILEPEDNTTQLNIDLPANLSVELDTIKSTVYDSVGVNRVKAGDNFTLAAKIRNNGTAKFSSDGIMLSHSTDYTSVFQSSKSNDSLYVWDILAPLSYNLGSEFTFSIISIPVDVNLADNALVTDRRDTILIETVEPKPPLISKIRYLDGGLDAIPDGEIDSTDLLKISFSQPLAVSSNSQLNADRYFVFISEESSFSQTDSGIVYSSDDIGYNRNDRDSVLFVKLGAYPLISTSSSSNLTRDLVSAGVAASSINLDSRKTLLKSNSNPSMLIVNPQIAEGLISGVTNNDAGMEVYRADLDSQFVDINVKNESGLFGKYSVLVEDSIKSDILYFYPNNNSNNGQFVSGFTNIKTLITGRNVVEYNDMYDELYQLFNQDTTILKTFINDSDFDISKIVDTLKTFDGSQTLLNNFISNLKNYSSPVINSADGYVINPVAQMFSPVSLDDVKFTRPDSNGISTEILLSDVNPMVEITKSDFDAIEQYGKINSSYNVTIKNKTKLPDGLSGVNFNLLTATDTSNIPFDIEVKTPENALKGTGGYSLIAGPNPFEPGRDEVLFQYELPEDNISGEIVILDGAGRKVITLPLSSLTAGRHSYTPYWNCKNSNEISVSPGLYFIFLKAGQELKASFVMVAH